MDIETTKEGVVVLNYDDLKAGKDYSTSIEKAFGYDGIGLLLVKGVPNFVQYRNNLLRLGYDFASLSDEIKSKYVNAASHFSFGWSFGKEKLQEGKFDEFKGSYYNNPQYDVPTTDNEKIQKYPESCLPNIWPKEDFPPLEPAFKQLGELIVDVGKLVGEQCDRHVKKLLPEYSSQIRNVIETSHTCKARLLYYYPIKNDQTKVRARDSWCGWHNDHSSLTGLAPAVYIDTDTGKEIPSPDPNAGLYVRTRAGQEFKVPIAPDCIAFQIGECSQVLTGGLLRATPHAVQAVGWPESAHVGRCTFAVFMQPDNEYVLKVPQGRDLAQAAVGQYSPGMTFVQFHQATIANFYAE